MSTAIGIDLGTTNTCFGFCANGVVELIPDEMGKLLIPSMVTFNNEQDILTGLAASDVAYRYPYSSIFEVKRLIGRHPGNKEIQQDIERLPYTVIDEDGLLKIKVRLMNDNDEEVWSKTVTPETISSYILKDVKALAKNRLQKNVTDAVVTVPAYFGSGQREATKRAAIMAGFSQVHIINEPTAAALAYQYKSKNKFTSKTLLIYDFGGGTFDVSVVKTKNNLVSVITTDGDCHLGGADIDMEIVKYLVKDIKDQHNISIEDGKRLNRLKDISNTAKEFLSRNKLYVGEIHNIHPDIPYYKFLLSKSDVDDIAKEIYQSTLKVVKRCLSSKNINKNDIDVVVLVGGSTRIPMINQMLGEYFGPDKISAVFNPDQLVAEGAAIHANDLIADKREMVFEDVLSLPLGTKVVGDKMSVILERNAKVPCAGFKKYKTANDNQEQMTIDVYQGESSLADENHFLGMFSINIETRAPWGQVIVEIKYSVDDEGILAVEASELNTDNTSKLTIDMKKSSASKGCLERLTDVDNVLIFSKYRLEFTEILTMCEKEIDKLEADEQHAVLKCLVRLDRDVNNLVVGNFSEMNRCLNKVNDLYTNIKAIIHKI